MVKLMRKEDGSLFVGWSEPATTLYLLTKGWKDDDEYRDLGLFSSLLAAQQHSPDGLTWEEDAAAGGQRFWAAMDEGTPWWVYEFVLDKVIEREARP